MKWYLSRNTLVISFVMSFFSCNTYTPQFTDTSGERISGSLAIMEEIEVNNSRQWIYCRGINKNKPILLFLHGGPGTASTGLIRKFVPELENRFVVIHWDQRGAGKSFSAANKQESFTVEKMIEDVGQLTEIILKKFNRNKIFIMGVSWGSYLGIEAIKRWPQYYTAYIGSGQIVYQNLGEQLSYDYVLQKATNEHNPKAIKDFQNIGYPPYPIKKHVPYLMKQRKWLGYYGGSFKNQEVQKEFSSFSILWKQEEFDFVDKINWIRGQLRSEKILGPEFRKVDFRQTAINFSIPIYIAQGKHDMQTPTSLVIDWFDSIQSPDKELKIFEESGHLPIVEEKESFISFIDEIIFFSKKRTTTKPKPH